MKKRLSSKTSQTDWKRVDAMRDKDIDLSDCPEATPESFRRFVVYKNGRLRQTKEPITLRLDTDVIKWFRNGGAGYEALINFVLRAYMQEKQRKAKRKKAAK